MREMEPIHIKPVNVDLVYLLVVFHGILYYVQSNLINYKHRCMFGVVIKYYLGTFSVLWVI